MKKVIVIGCPGSGKSVFSRKLHDMTRLPLYHLDMIYWRKDKTSITRGQLIEQLMKIVVTDEWILDGNFRSTMELRMSYCDTVVFLDYPTEVCYEGIMDRRGKARPDLPWIEPADEIDEEFVNAVKRYNTVDRPAVLEMINRFPDREVYIFKSRAEADAFFDSLRNGADGRMTGVEK